MIRTLQSKVARLPGRQGAALVIAVCAAALSTAVASAQNAATVSVNPNSGAPGSQFSITLNNYHACAADKPSCIIIDFVQSGKATRVGTADSKGSPTFSGSGLTIPPSATAGPAIIHAFSDTDDAQTGFTVTNAPPATTTTAPAGTTTAPTTTTTVAPTTTVTTVVPPLTEPSTTTTIAPKKSSSSHSDVPRYIAVILVVLAAAATAAVDTRMRRMNPPPGGP